MVSFDWEDFRHFAALSQTLHLGMAAARLKTSQVTVMRRVKALELSLGKTLFVRRRDGHLLTAAGAKLVRFANEAEQLFGEIERDASNADAATEGRVRIATTEVGANWLLLPAIRAFRESNPHIVLEIDASPHALDLLKDGDTIALRFRRPDDGPHVIKRLGSVDYAIYARSSAPGRRADDVSHRLGDLPYIGWAEPMGEIGPARWLRTIFGSRAPSLLLTTFQGQIDGARQGLGVAALPRFVGRRFSELVEVEHDGPAFALEAWLVVPAQIRKMARIRAAIRFIESAVNAGLASQRTSVRRRH